MRLAVVAADYTPGEADQLRRDMAAWQSTGRIEQHRERLVQRMQAKGIAPEFAERVFEQIRGFGEYGFPESHAASFAVIAYGTSWLKRHYPAEFTCALLNAQPMGFYSPATVVEDAKRHGVEIRPVDARASAWDCTLERAGGDDAPPRFAVRMGLRYVKGLGEPAGARIQAVRGDGSALHTVPELARAARLDVGAMSALAQAGAFESLGVDRREALWESLGEAPPEPAAALPLEAAPAPSFTRLTEFQTIDWDYHASDHSVRGHPLAPIRKELVARGLVDAATLATRPHGQRVRYAGIVICRQRPGTASGVTFMTLEDESGFVNLVIWKQVFDAHAVLARTATLLGVTGRLQSEQGVVHVIAERLWLPDVDAAPATGGSRDFH
jgi:error-prone DNA polymerase